MLLEDDSMVNIVLVFKNDFSMYVAVGQSNSQLCCLKNRVSNIDLINFGRKQYFLILHPIQ